MREEAYTEEDIRKIREEIEYRKSVVRPQKLEDIKEARSYGDLSENFEYQAARRENSQNESRISYLERLLRSAKVVTDESAEDEVGLNNLVDLYFEEDDETETYKLVTSIRGNSLKNYISVESPLGRAILGHRTGERVEVNVSRGSSYFVEIRAIDKTAGEEDDAIRGY